MSGAYSVMDTRKPIANPQAVFREEFDDWAILFDPDTMKAVGLNPIGAFIWKLLDGRHTLSDILEELKESCEDVPEEAGDHLRECIDKLFERGFVGYGIDDK
jgi:SynChlorMet cassette protein ScmD